MALGLLIEQVHEVFGWGVEPPPSSAPSPA